MIDWRHKYYGAFMRWEPPDGRCVTPTTNVIHQKEYKITFHYCNLVAEITPVGSRSFHGNYLVINENKDKFYNLQNDH